MAQEELKADMVPIDHCVARVICSEKDSRLQRYVAIFQSLSQPLTL